MNVRSLFPIIAVLAAPLGAAPQHSVHGDLSAGLVEHVRQVTQGYHDVRQAMDAGYVQFLGCVSGPQKGAMGVHFVNSSLVGDGELDVDRPEALIYEPKGGALKLVGVEYLVVADAWHK